jgi:hypothetical protein
MTTLAHRRRVSESFDAYEKIPGDVQCIDRVRYRFELSRFLGLDPYVDILATPHVFVIGDKTMIGEALVRVLAQRKAEIVRVGCESSLDFSSEDAAQILQAVNMSEAIVTCPMVVPARSTTNGTTYLVKRFSSYLSGVFANLAALKIPTTYAVDGVLHDEHAKIAASYGVNVYVTPHLLSLRGKIADASRDCELRGRTIVELEEGERTSDLTSDQIAEFLLRPRSYSEPETIDIEGTASEDTEKLIRDLCPFCNVTFRKVVSHRPIQNVVRNKVTIEGAPDAIPTFLQRETFVTGVKRIKSTSHYLTIVVAGTEEDFTANALARFLRAVDFGLSKAPTADLEIIFVEYNVTHSARDAIEVPKLLEGHVRFISLSGAAIEEIGRRGSFPEPFQFFGTVARNVGIRRALGEYVLCTTVATLLPSTFFELVARQDFNEGVFYQAKQYDIDVDDSAFYHLLDVMHEKWRFREINATKHCRKFRRRLLVADTVAKFMEGYEDCGVENFALMSRRLWRALAAYDESNDYAEMYTTFLAKLMRQIYGGVRMFIQPIALHSNDAVIRDPPPAEQNITKILEDEACFGESEDRIGTGNEQFWGARTEPLPDDVI